MFESVMAREGLREERFGTGVWVSLGVHAGLLAAVLVLSGRPAEPPEEELKMGPLVVHLPGPTLARGSPAPAPPRPTVASKPRPRPRERVPRQVRPLPEVPPPPAPPEAPEVPDAPPAVGDTDEDTGVPGGHPEGDPNSTSLIGSLPLPGVPLEATGTDVVEFNTEMRRPELLAGPPLGYTHEALQARVEGKMVVRCVITREGQVRDCRVLKGLPYMTQAVVEALSSRRYRPMEYRGQRVNVVYNFLLQLKLP